MAGQIARFRGRAKTASGDDRRQIAHAIKGAACTIGANALAAAAENFEGAPNDEALRRDFEAELEQLEISLDARAGARLTSTSRNP
ncbi:MAG: Hpt domain-containing protein [Rhizobiaceae bacterium]|nr:Hpt domain-containing protein [Rhizobiaceae bacterium]